MLTGGGISVLRSREHALALDVVSICPKHGSRLLLFDSKDRSSGCLSLRASVFLQIWSFQFVRDGDVHVIT